MSMSSNKPKKIHYWAKGDKYTKCGRDPKSLDFPTSPRIEQVTCQHCLTPNKPFTVSPLR
jgi:hypothetical protein